MNSPHLTHDELMQAIIDETQLSAQARQHLLVCADCKERKFKTANRLSNIKNLSNRISTQSKPWYHFRSGDGQGVSDRPFGIKYMLIIVVVAALIFILSRHDPFERKSHEEAAPSPGDPPMITNILEPIDPLPEIYSELLSLWWRKEAFAERLDLTPEEIGKLDVAWKEALLAQEKFKKALSDGQVALIITLEKKQWDTQMVQRLYQQLSNDFAQSTNTRFLLLLNIRTILGHERFQELLRLLKQF